MVYLPFEDEFRCADQVAEGTQFISLSGSDIRERIRTGRKIPDWATFPEVVEELQKAYPPPRTQGLTVFLTGLSGAGKSTIAKVLYARFLEIGGSSGNPAGRRHRAAEFVQRADLFQRAPGY